MKLNVKRDQEDIKGLLGGHKGVRFILSAQVQLDQNEAGLAERYKILEKWIPPELAGGIKGAKTSSPVTFKALLSPIAFEYEALSVLLEKEDLLKSLCADVANYLKVASTFGGQETYEFK